MGLQFKTGQKTRLSVRFLETVCQSKPTQTHHNNKKFFVWIFLIVIPCITAASGDAPEDVCYGHIVNECRSEPSIPLLHWVHVSDEMCSTVRV